MRGVLRTVSLAAVVLLALLLVTPALAHENRDVGPYRLTVGLNAEPAFENQMNGAQLRVRRVSDLSAVTGLADTLKVEVTYSGLVKPPMSLRAVFGQDGLYVADFLPTASGRYQFRFFGKIEGMDINETFESGPGRFNDIQPIGDTAFPKALPNLAGAEAIAREASDTASLARTLGIVGIVVGAVGIAVGGAGIAMAARRRP